MMKIIIEVLVVLHICIILAAAEMERVFNEKNRGMFLVLRISTLSRVVLVV